MTKSDLVKIRDIKPEDKNFILSTWLRGLYYGDSWFSLMDKNEFMKNYHNILEQLLAPGRSKILVACLKEDDDTIVGYAAVNNSETSLHYVFVKSAWRKIGIATLLVPKSVVTVTHLTKTGLSILKIKNLSFNPFLL